MNTAKRGEWVQIHNVILKPGERAPQVPEDTKKVPLDMWVKGFLLSENAQIGTEVIVRTVTGREVKGTLVKLNPSYDHNFGEPQPELLTIGSELRTLLKGVSQ